MSTTSSDLRARNLRTLAVLGGLFLVPLVVSFWMYYATDWRPSRRVNHGDLITPPRALPHSDLPAAQGAKAAGQLFSHNWTLVYVGSGECGASCRHALYVMRQTRLALNNDMARVDRVFLVTGRCCDRDFLSTQHFGMIVLDATGAAAAALLQPFPRQREHLLFIVDPLGNLMMSFDTRANPQGLLQDLQKLLRLSSIG